MATERVTRDIFWSFMFCRLSIERKEAKKARKERKVERKAAKR